MKCGKICRFETKRRTGGTPRAAVRCVGAQTGWMMETITLAVVLLVGTYLVALGAAALLAPQRAARFLNAFAGSRSTHLTELGLRFVAGGAFVLHAPRMMLPNVFSLLGWVLLTTTACLLLIPWRWHRRFARQAVPRALRYLTPIGVCALALGALILATAVRGHAA